MRFFKPVNGYLGIIDKTIDGIGGVVDETFLTLPKLLKPFKPKREIDRKTYEMQVDFYCDHHFVDHPETFFQVGQPLPAYSIVSEIPFSEGGVRREISFSSHYTPRNLLVSD
jgi:hypothetical protein